MTRVTDGVSYDAVGAGTYGPFSLVGGIYQVAAYGIVTGTVTLSMQVPGTAASPVWLSVDSITTSGGGTLYLPPGRYKFVITTDPAVTAWTYKVPVE